MSDRYLIVGLGNPGKKYEDTRHNVGWGVLDELARRHGLNFDKTEKKSLTANGKIGGQRVLLAKPQTFMNLSGEAVRGLVDFYKIDIPQIIIVSDDLDIPLGTLRLRKSGGAGGQRGLKNVLQHLGTRDIDRVRFGIGRPPGKMDPAAYVLQAFQGDDAILAREVTNRAADAVELWLKEGIDPAMTLFNGDIRAKQPEPETDPAEDLAKFMRAHELDVANPGPVESIIGVLKRMGRIDEAADWHLKLAAMFDERGKKGKAMAQRERAASLEPQRIDLHRQIAEMYVAQDNKRKAVERLLILAGYLEGQGDFSGALQARAGCTGDQPAAPQSDGDARQAEANG